MQDSFHAPPQTPLLSFLGFMVGQFETPLMKKINLWSTTEAPHINIMPIFELQMCYSSNLPNYKYSAQVVLTDAYITQSS